jgi:hypothetical protein
MGAVEPIATIVNLEVPTHFEMQGACLLALTQSLAYQGIKYQIPEHTRKTTKWNIEIIKVNLQPQHGTSPTDEEI